MKLRLYYIGKARDEPANRMAADYLERTGRWADCQMREIDPKRFDPARQHAAAYKIYLDPAGKIYDSAKFASLMRRLEDEGRETLFVVGGHDGLPPEWKPRADLLLSISPMTFPHELARAMLAEQIYRAFATIRGHPYPR